MARLKKRKIKPRPIWDPRAQPWGKHPLERTLRATPTAKPELGITPTEARLPEPLEAQIPEPIVEPELGGWTITPTGTFVSPLGKEYTEIELDTAIDTGEVTYADFGLPTPMPELGIIRDIQEATFLRQVEEQRDIESLLGDIIPEVPPQYESALEWASDEKNLDDLFLGIQNAGQTPATEALLARFGATEEQIEEFFPETKKWWTLDFWLDNFFKPYGGTDLKGKAAASFMAGIGDMAQSAGGAARWLGQDELGVVLSNIGTPLQRVAPPSTVGEFEWADMLDPEFYATKVARTVPFALALMPAGVGGFYGGTALATAVGLGKIWAYIVGGLTGAALSRPAESAFEAGGAYDDAIARGKTEAEAKEEATEVFRKNMVLVGADAWEIGIALAPTPKWVPGALVRNGLVRTARIAGKMVIVGLSEGGEEIYQDMILRHARGEEWQLDPIAKEVFAIGFTMGAGMGLGGDVISSIVNKSKGNMTTEQRRLFNDMVNTFREEGFTEEQAELRSLNQILEEQPTMETIVNDAIDEYRAEQAVKPVEEAVPPTVIEPAVAEEIKALLVEETPTTIIEEGGTPISPEEPIASGVEENIPIIQDVGLKEEVRTTRKVYERMGLPLLPRSLQKAEVRLLEEKIKKMDENKKALKSVDKKRWSVVFDKVDLGESIVGLKFEEKQAVGYMRAWANEWADRKNIPPEKRIKNYIPHLFEEEMVAQLKESGEIAPELAFMLEERAKSSIIDPFLKERLGAVGFIKDPVKAMNAYDAASLRVIYYEPLLKKISLIANDPKQPKSVRNWLKEYSRRLTNEPSNVDQRANTTLLEGADIIRKLPGIGPWLADRMSQGNPMGMLSQNLASAYYFLWMGYKLTTSIRNLSQHTLILAETGPQYFAEGIGLRFTKEGRDAANKSSYVWRGRKVARSAATVPGLEDAMLKGKVRSFVDTALFLFNKADEQNVKDAFLAGYAEAKDILTKANDNLPADKKVSQEELYEYLAWRGDEVAADTQYLYTKLNAMAVSRSGLGKVLSVLTTWTSNWLELMAKWVAKRPSIVYQQFEKRTGAKLPKKNWSATYKSLILYLAIIGLMYAVKERTRLKAWEYTGITSLRYLADVAAGDFPGLEIPGAVASVVAGITTDDPRRLKTGWNALMRTLRPSIIQQIQKVASGDRDWLTILFYMEGKDIKIKRLEEKWDKGWVEYEELPASKRDEYRKGNPIIEAQMFITSDFTILTTDEARAEVLRLIGQHDIDTELIEGYEKVFGVDTDIEISKNRKQLGQVELDEEGEQKLKENGELDYYTTSNFATDVNALVKRMGRDKVVMDGNPLAVEYITAKDQFVQYDNLTTDEGRVLFRQQFPDVEAQLYLWGKIASFKNPKSAEILLGLMEKYNIPPESIPAFLEDPSKYDELFTLKHELSVKSFALDTQYENYGNPESPLFIPDKPISELTWDDEMAGKIPAKDYAEWKIYQSLITKAPLEISNIDQAIKELQFYSDTHTSDSAWDIEWRGHYSDMMEAFGEIKAKGIENYPEQRIHGLLQTLYWDIKADIRSAEKYEIEGDKERAKFYRTASHTYSAIASMLATSIQPDISSREYLNQHPELAVDLRKETRAKLKEDNPDWVADLKRIQAIDHDATPEIIEKWAEQGAKADEFGGGSNEVKDWFLDNPEVYDWAVEQGLKEDTRADWNETIIRLKVQYAEQFDLYDSYADREHDNYIADETLRAEKRQAMFDDPKNKGFVTAYYKDKASSQGYSEVNWDEFVMFSQLPQWGGWQDRFLLDPHNSTFATEYFSPNVGEYHPRPTDVNLLNRDRIYEKFYDDFQRHDLYDRGGKEKLLEDDKFYEAYRKVQAYDKGLPEEFVKTYVEWFRTIEERIKSKDIINGHWYEDDWFLMENMGFYKAMFEAEIWKDKDRYDFREALLAQKVWDLYETYRAADRDGRLNMRAKYPNLDKFLLMIKEVSVPIGDRGDGEVTFKEEEVIDERLKEIEAGLAELLE